MALPVFGFLVPNKIDNITSCPILIVNVQRLILQAIILIQGFCGKYCDTHQGNQSLVFRQKANLPLVFAYEKKKPEPQALICIH